MTRRSILEEHARDRERARKEAAQQKRQSSGNDDADVDDDDPKQHKSQTIQPQPRASSAPASKADDEEMTRLRKEVEQLKKTLIQQQIAQQNGPDGDRAKKAMIAREIRERDLARKETQRQSTQTTHHLVKVKEATHSEGEKSRTLAKKHHKEHIEELKKQREKKGFFERGPVGKILFLLGTAFALFMLYNKIKFGLRMARLLAPTAGKVGRAVTRVVKAVAKRVVKAVPGIGRAAQRGRIAVKKAYRKTVSRGTRKAVARTARQSAETIRQATSGRASPGIRRAAREAFLPSASLGSAAALAVGGYAAYKGAQNAGKLFDGSQALGDRLQAGAHLAVSGAGGFLGSSLGKFIPGVGAARGAAYGAAAGNLLADGAESVGKRLANTSMGDAVGGAIAKVLSPFSKEASDALSAQARLHSGVLEDAKKNQADRQKADKANVKDMAAAIAPMAESTRTFSEKVAEYATIASKATGAVWQGVKNAGANLVQGVKNGAGTIAEGYAKGGVMGAARASGKALGKVGSGISDAGSALKSGVIDAVEGAKYDLNKGSKSELSLANGFQGRNTIKGLTDSQTKALAGTTMATESGGKLGITNRYGFSGQYQMGADAMADNGLMDRKKLDAAKAASKAAGRNWYADGDHKAFMDDDKNYLNKGGKKAFLEDKQLQDDTFVKYTNKNIEAGLRSGALTGTSTPAEIAAYAKAAHLKGPGGANDYVLRGKDSTDANGTKVSSYANQAAKSMTALASKVEAQKLATKGQQPDSKIVGNALGPDGKPKAALLGSPVSKAQVAETSAKVAPTAPLPARVEAAKSEIVQSQPRVAETATVSPSAAPVAKATPQPQAIVSKQTPTEAQSAALAASNSAPAPKEPTGSTVARGQQATQGGPSQGNPTLDEIPIMISDFGLVLLNIGHI